MATMWSLWTHSQAINACTVAIATVDADTLGRQEDEIVPVAPGALVHPSLRKAPLASSLHLATLYLSDGISLVCAALDLIIRTVRINIRFSVRLPYAPSPEICSRSRSPTP